MEIRYIPAPQTLYRKNKKILYHPCTLYYGMSLWQGLFSSLQGGPSMNQGQPLEKLMTTDLTLVRVRAQPKDSALLNVSATQAPCLIYLF